jgi:hypothetical protein
MFPADFILRDNSEHRQLLACPLSSSGVLHTPSTTTTNRTELHQMVLNINKKYPNYYLQIEPNHYLQIEPNHYPQIEPKHYLQPTNSYKSNRITTYKSNRITTYKSNRILPTNRTKPCLRACINGAEGSRCSCGCILVIASGFVKNLII